MKKNQLENTRIKYQMALNLFIAEGQNQWNRYNAMLVINTILIGAIGLRYSGENTLSENLRTTLQYMPIVGVLICFLWIVMAIRGFQYKKKWMDKARAYEKDLNTTVSLVEDKRKANLFTVKNAAYSVILIFFGLYILLLRA